MTLFLFCRKVFKIWRQFQLEISAHMKCKPNLYNKTRRENKPDRIFPFFTKFCPQVWWDENGFVNLTWLLAIKKFYFIFFFQTGFFVKHFHWPFKLVLVNLNAYKRVRRRKNCYQIAICIIVNIMLMSCPNILSFPRSLVVVFVALNAIYSSFSWYFMDKCFRWM